MDVGFLALIPPLLAIAIALITKEVLLALIIGVASGTLIMTDFSPLASFELLMELILASLTEPEYMQVILICMMLGGLIGLLVRSGGATAFSEFLQKKVSSRKGAQTTTWIVGLMLFFDDYFNCLTNGSVMRSISDDFKISREKFSYIVDTTAVSICLIIPLSSWVAFITSLISYSFERAGIEEDAYLTFIASIPFNFYALTSLIMVMFVIHLKLNFRPMAKAEARVLKIGVVCEGSFSGGDAESDDFSLIERMKGKASDLLVPIGVLYVLAFVFILYTGGFFLNFDLIEAFNEMDGLSALIYSIFVAIITAIILYAVKRLSKVTDSIMAFVAGTKSMVLVIIVLVFAWSLGAVTDELGAADYLVDIMIGTVPSAVIPTLIFIISYLTAFATGASWSTYAIMLPMAAPIALGMNASILASITAVIGGGGCGQHCSPLADSSILSSAASNIRIIDHVKSQAPYALVCGSISIVGYLVTGFIGADATAGLPLIVVAATFAGVVILLKMVSAKHRHED